MNMTTQQDLGVASMFSPERINDYFNQARITVQDQEITSLLLSPLGIKTMLDLGMKTPKQYIVPPWVSKEEALKRFKAMTKLTMKPGHGKFPMYRICGCIYCSYYEKNSMVGFEEIPPPEIAIDFIPDKPSLKPELEVLRMALLEHCGSSFGE